MYAYEIGTCTNVDYEFFIGLHLQRVVGLLITISNNHLRISVISHHIPSRKYPLQLIMIIIIVLFNYRSQSFKLPVV